jgi:uncharacterized RDD family membrane protein YckC
MAFCTSCGNEISPVAVACPQCGQPTGYRAATSLENADFWTRLGGWLLDVLILIIPSFILNISVYPFIGGLLVDFLYHWLTVAYGDGQTVGKRVVGVRVTRPDGSPVDPAVAAGRALMRIVSGLVFGLGFLWAAWDAEKRTWHDMTADTRVFRVR